MQEAPVAGPSRSNTPAPMETGGVGDGQTWAEWVETSAEAEFQWARPLKHPRSQSRRRQIGPRLPFPLQDVEGRLASIERLYEYVGEQPSPQDDVAGRAIRHLHPEILPPDAQRLGNSEDGSLWESFPQILRMLDGAKWYMDAFRAPLQGLTMMKSQQVHALRACSLVVIPPSEERMPPPGGFLRDLSGMNLTSWAGLIQDVAQGMKVVPPNLSMEVCLDSMVLLQLLEATTGMGHCRICCKPSPRCHCIDDYQLAPTET